MAVKEVRNRAIKLAVLATAILSTAELGARALADPALGGVGGLTLGALRTLIGGVTLLLLARRDAKHIRPQWNVRIFGQLLLFAAAAAAASYFAALGAQVGGVAPTALMFTGSALLVVAIRAVQARLAHQKVRWTRADSLGAFGCLIGSVLFSQVWSSGLRSLADFLPGLVGACAWAVWPTMSAGFRERLGDRTGFMALGLAQLAGGLLLSGLVIAQVTSGSIVLHLPQGLFGWAIVFVLGAGVTGYATKLMTELIGLSREVRLPNGTVVVDPIGLKWQLLAFVKPALAGALAALLFSEPFFTGPKIGGTALIILALIYARLPRR